MAAAAAASAAGAGGGAAATKPSSSASAAKGAAAALPPGQRVGLASALLVEEASSSRTDGANRATFRLTPELVLQIFAERPYVRAAYAAAVPRACGEAEFWKRYLRYEAVRKARRRLKAAGRDPGEAGPEDELFRQFRAERRAEAFGPTAATATATIAGDGEAQDGPLGARGHPRHHHSHVDPGVDLEADAADSAPPGYGLAHAGARDPSVGGGSAARPRSAATAAAAAERDAIVHELNRHAAVVLAGVPAGLPSDAAAAARALKEGPSATAAGGAGGGAAASGAAVETNASTNTPAAVAAAKGAKATAAAASEARDREENERWRDRAGAGLDDLNPAPQEEFEALTVADPRGYFGGGEQGDGDRGGGGGARGAPQANPSASSSSSSSKSWSPEAILASLRAPMKKQHAALAFDAFSLFQPRDAVRALRDLALAAAAGEETVSADELMLAAATGGGGAGSLSAAAALAADPAAALPPPLLALLRQAALTANELLRHFWSSSNASEASSSTAVGATAANAAASAAAAAARSSRVVKALGTQYDRIQAMQGAASSGSERAAVRRLLAPVAAAIDVALERAAEMERKAAAGGGTGAGAVPMETN